MASIGWATLSVIPEVQKVPSGIAQQIGAPLRAAGAQAGRDAGEAIAGGIAAAQMKVDKATDALAKSQDKVADAAGRTRVAQAQLNALTDKGVTDSARLTAANEKLEAARRKELAATRDATKAADNLAEAERRAATATDDVADTAERAGGGFKSMFSGVGDGTKKLAGLAAGLAGVSAAADGMGKAMEQGQAGSKLAASFGESAEEAKRYGEVAGNLSASGVGTGLEDIEAAVAAVGGSFGSLDTMGAGRLEELSTKASGFATIFDQDVAGSVQAASQLMTNGLAANADEAFDLMTRGMQEVSVEMRGELPEILNEYGTNFRALGFDGAESFNMLIAASQNGGIALDKTGDALKEFTIRGSDMSKSSSEAYDAIGLDAELMADRIAAGGDGAQAALQETAAGLLGIEDPAVRANTAIALFGSPLEDLSVDQIPAFLSGIAGAEDVMGDFNGALDGSIDVLNDNAGSSLETFKRGLEQNITNMIGDNVLPMLGDFTGALEENEGSAIATIAGMTGLGGAMAGFETAKGAFDSVKEGVMGVKDGLMEAKDTASAALDGLKTGASAVKDGFGTAKTAASTAASSAKAAATSVAAGTAALAANTGAWVANGIATARAGVAYVAQKVALVASTVATAAATGAQWLLNVALSANPIGLIIAAVAALVAGLVWFFTQTEIGQKIVTAAWDAILSGWNWMYDKVSSGIQLLGDGLGYIGEKAGEAKDWVVGKFNDLVGFITGLPGQIAAAASGMWDGLTESFKSAINWIIGKWNDFRLVIGGGTILGKQMPSITLDTPNIPMLAAGGVAGRGKDGKLFGPGTGTSDSILGVNEWGMPTALVSDEEGVVKKTAMDSGGDRIVAALNAGWVPTADFLHGMMQGDFRANPLGIQEDSPLVAGALGLQSLLAKGDYTGNLSSIGFAEDNPLIGGILDAREFVQSLPRFADGGVVNGDQLADFAKDVEGKPYEWGGVNWGDCSGAVSALANYVTGREPFASRFATGNEAAELADRGFADGLGPSGSLQIGWFNGGPYGGHTAATLPNGVNFEMGGGRGDGQYGGQAAGASDPSFTDHAHIAVSAGQAMADAASQAPADMANYWSPDAAPSASSPAVSATSPSAPAAAPEPTQSFSARDRYKKMFTDIGGIWADASIEIFGAGEWLDLADRYTIKSSDSGGGTSQAAPTSAEDPKNGVVGDPNVTPLIEQAQNFLRGVGLFDTGGILEPGKFGFNGLNEPEMVLKDAHWKVAEANIGKVDDLVGAGVGGSGVSINQTFNTTVADQAGFHRRANRDRSLAMMQYGGRPEIGR